MNPGKGLTPGGFLENSAKSAIQCMLGYKLNVKPQIVNLTRVSLDLISGIMDVASRSLILDLGEVD